MIENKPHYKIVVCIKQVPDTDDIKWTKQNTIDRVGLDSIMNPFDYGALQLAKNIKFLKPETEIIAVSMGPEQAIDAVKKAIAICADTGYLLCDKKFSGSDTLATAYTISMFIKNIVPDYNLIICGQQAIDGDTAQTPSSLAAKLGIEQVTNVVAIKEIQDNSLVCIKETKSYKQEVAIQDKAVIATTNRISNICADINGYIKAQDTSIIKCNADDINVDVAKIGIKGSPTQVKKAFKPEIKRQTELLENQSNIDYATYILEQISKCKVKND